MNDADDEMTEGISDEDSSFDDDGTSLEASSEPSDAMSYDSYAPEFYVYPNIIIKQEDSDY